MIFVSWMGGVYNLFYNNIESAIVYFLCCLIVIMLLNLEDEFIP